MNVEFALTQQDWGDMIAAASIFAGTIAIAFLTPLILRFLRVKVAARTRTSLDERLLSRTVAPAVLGVLLGGFYLTLLQITALDAHRTVIRTYFVVAAIIVGALAVAQVTTAMLNWYGAEIAHRTKTDLDAKLVPIFRRLTNLVVYGIALILILDRLGVQISPLIAGLGIGGLAVALAIQPFLASFLAGTSVIADAIIKQGDYIELDSGQTGYVETIGWRTTKIRHWQGNIVVLPNSTLANAVVTNYEAPEPPMMFFVPCGVSYDTDLQKAEDAALEVARQVTRDCPEAVHDFEPLFRWRAFGDSNIDFVVILKGLNRVANFIVRSDFIKVLHKRFTEEGIEINYPARKLQFSNELQIRMGDIDLERIVRESREKTLDQRSDPSEAQVEPDVTDAKA